ncbi:MAG TPA: DNA-processing protein DprA [Actinomycetota bacterium]|nr:DNA-processing protein DprA [Actinomycetota bacterium]
MRSRPRHRVPDGLFERASGGGVRARVPLRELTPDDPEFPEGVRTMPRAPSRLWVAGRDLRTLGSMVAVIGARRATRYGLSMAAGLAGDLAAGGVCVVSGLARGCDSAAHDGALERGGTTVAVLGSGADVCYPAGSRVLYSEILAAGAVVSARPPGYRPFKSDFVYRNSIMVAMSEAVVVVQGTTDSAAVRTGEDAAGAGHGSVFAVPGSVEWPESAGVHKLLKLGATVCTSASDIVEPLQDRLRWTPPELQPVPRHLPEPQRRILEALAGGAAGREEVVAASALEAAAASRAIAELEMAGLIVEEGFFLRRTR